MAYYRFCPACGTYVFRKKLDHVACLGCGWVGGRKDLLDDGGKASALSIALELKKMKESRST